MSSLKYAVCTTDMQAAQKIIKRTRGRHSSKGFLFTGCPVKSATFVPCALTVLCASNGGGSLSANKQNYVHMQSTSLCAFCACCEYIISRNGPYIGGHLAFYFKLNVIQVYNVL